MLWRVRSDGISTKWSVNNNDAKMRQTLFLELNEINFGAVREYVAQGRLPALGRVIRAQGVRETTSEARYEEIEPWIQWVTAHTGMTLAEHGVFRLGDIVDQDIPQIWERLEEQGVTVGAVSPMNAKNRTKQASFFIPDPWTPTEVTGSFLARNLYDAISQAVNDNAQARIALRSIFWLLVGAARYARVVNYPRYLRMALGARRKPWYKAMFLDLLLADVFIKLTASTRPGFATLFLNAGAHIQHHYMFSSDVYNGPQRNPDWYVDPESDPVFEVYELYDRIVAQVTDKFPDARLLIATGLHQDPHPKLTYYWRLTDHSGFLARHGILFTAVEPKMSRDFHIRCADAEQARAAEAALNAMRDVDGVALFEVDNRGDDLFVMLTYPHDIPVGFEYRTAAGSARNLRDDVAFVAIKNGQHNSIGYFIDCGGESSAEPQTFPLAEMPEKVTAAVLG